MEAAPPLCQSGQTLERPGGSNYTERGGTQALPGPNLWQLPLLQPDLSWCLAFVFGLGSLSLSLQLEQCVSTGSSLLNLGLVHPLSHADSGSGSH